jgi:transposase-like protein
MKHCPKCGKDLPVSAFNRNRARTDGLGSECRKCRQTYKRTAYQPAYTIDDLRYRPIEHIMEEAGGLGARELGQALGINKSTAMLLKRNPHLYVDTPLELDDASIRRIRDWMERQG